MIIKLNSKLKRYLDVYKEDVIKDLNEVLRKQYQGGDITDYDRYITITDFDTSMVAPCSIYYDIYIGGFKLFVKTSDGGSGEMFFGYILRRGSKIEKTCFKVSGETRNTPVEMCGTYLAYFTDMLEEALSRTEVTLKEPHKRILRSELNK